MAPLRPASGSGEDWNLLFYDMSRADLGVALGRGPGDDWGFANIEAEAWDLGR